LQEVGRVLLVVGYGQDSYFQFSVVQKRSEIDGGKYSKTLYGFAQILP